MNIAKAITGPKERGLHTLEAQTVWPFTKGFHFYSNNSVKSYRSETARYEVLEVDPCQSPDCASQHSRPQQSDEKCVGPGMELPQRVQAYARPAEAHGKGPQLHILRAAPVGEVYACRSLGRPCTVASPTSPEGARHMRASEGARLAKRASAQLAATPFSRGAPPRHCRRTAPCQSLP